MMMFASGFMLGLFSTPHCVGMCGGLASAMTYGLVDKSPLAVFCTVLKLNAARVVSYSIIGVMAGLLGVVATDMMPALVVVFRTIAGLLLILSGLYIAKWWLGLRHLESLALGLWQRGQKRFASVKGPRFSPVVNGLMWGCLPCGLVYSAVGLAITQGGVMESMAFMAAFGMGTLPVLIFVAMAASNLQQFLRQQWLTSAVGLSLMIYGVWTIVAVMR